MRPWKDLRIFVFYIPSVVRPYSDRAALENAMFCLCPQYSRVHCCLLASVQFPSFPDKCTVPSLVCATLLSTCLGLPHHDVENFRELSVSHLCIFRQFQISASAKPCAHHLPFCLSAIIKALRVSSAIHCFYSNVFGHLAAFFALKVLDAHFRLIFLFSVFVICVFVAPRL